MTASPERAPSATTRVMDPPPMPPPNTSPCGRWTLRYTNNYSINPAGYGGGGWRWDLVDNRDGGVLKTWDGFGSTSPWDASSSGIAAVAWDGDLLAVTEIDPGAPDHTTRVAISSLRLDAALEYLRLRQSPSGAFGDPATTAAVVAALRDARATAERQIAPYHRALAKAEAFLSRNPASDAPSSVAPSREALVEAQRLDPQEHGGVLSLGDPLRMTALLVRALAG